MENKSKIYNKLTAQLEQANVVLYPDMGKYCSFRCGGKAEMLIEPSGITELEYALSVLDEYDCDFTLLGNGTNTLFKDEGYDGVVVYIGEDFAYIRQEDDTSLTAGAGTLLSAFARTAKELSLSGLEFASGIPGSVGGACFMNAGAYDGEMGFVLKEVKTISRDGKKISTYKVEDLKLSYRHSLFMETGEIVLEATVSLEKKPKEEIEEKMRDFTKRRNEKQPVNYPSAGSFFKRPLGHFAGKLIQDAGLMGVSVGDACVSTLHAGFIINKGDASASEVIELMHLVQNTVYDKFGVNLEPEVRII